LATRQRSRLPQEVEQRTTRRQAASISVNPTPCAHWGSPFPRAGQVGSGLRPWMGWLRCNGPFGTHPPSNALANSVEF
jgi:hypothetical protein